MSYSQNLNWSKGGDASSLFVTTVTHLRIRRFGRQNWLSRLNCSAVEPTLELLAWTLPRTALSEVQTTIWRLAKVMPSYML